MLAGYIIAFLMDLDTDLNDVGFNAVFGLLHIKACVSLMPENAFKTAMVALVFFGLLSSSFTLRRKC